MITSYIRNFCWLMRVLAMKTQVHIVNTSRTSTRSCGLFDKVKVKLAQVVLTYWIARKVIESLAPNEEFSPWKDSLLELRNDDIHGPGCDKSQSSKSCFVQSWIWTTALLSRRWYILHYHRSTLLLPLGEVVAGGGRVEERSEVMYWHRGAYIIYYRGHNVSQLYSMTDGGLRPRL